MTDGAERFVSTIRQSRPAIDQGTPELRSAPLGYRIRESSRSWPYLRRRGALESGSLSTRARPRRTRPRARRRYRPWTRGGRAEPGRRHGDRGRTRPGRARPVDRPIPRRLRQGQQPGARLGRHPVPGTTYPEVRRLATVSVPEAVTVLENGDIDVAGVGKISFGFTRTERASRSISVMAENAIKCGRTRPWPRRCTQRPGRLDPNPGSGALRLGTVIPVQGVTAPQEPRCLAPRSVGVA